MSGCCPKSGMGRHATKASDQKADIRLHQAAHLTMAK